jgi:hypothetical protein
VKRLLYYDLAIPDTIDRNAGLEGVEYLKNVLQSKSTGDNRRVKKKKHDIDESNLWSNKPAKTFHKGSYEV